MSPCYGSYGVESKLTTAKQFFFVYHSIYPNDVLFVVRICKKKFCQCNNKIISDLDWSIICSCLVLFLTTELFYIKKSTK